MNGAIANSMSLKLAEVVELVLLKVRCRKCGSLSSNRTSASTDQNDKQRMT
jgi:hypothetical protein